MSDSPKHKRQNRAIGATLILSIVGAAVFIATDIYNAGPQAEGASIAVSLGALAIALIAWSKQILPQTQLVSERPPLPAPHSGPDSASETFAEGEREVVSRRGLTGLLAAAVGTLGVAAIFPVRSLGPMIDSLFHTRWSPGARVVDGDGVPVHRGSLGVKSMMTVFPEGYTDSQDSQTLLIRTPPGTVPLPPDRANWAPDGYIAFSKVCTHAGCPVALFRATDLLLMCPCHQSIFDVLQLAARISGPAARPLPQLPLEIDADGFLHAQSDYHEAIGPSFWERPG
ncbi:MAG: ubiquinol-cytochrome c reductase iron-sulfur subunit [Candidatus Eremiobacteraeota bacterium]|nr:ubiquinol-cytochrome c reductase iron-sulfur subunit [Candidatus Eremiobacteraeota bacterium]MBC5801798.1 ubiquinol-cytochrome c reductase iron-sulfur subunit [Candidatus Eremiobacteraeota bacterium]MBC5823136.1 ubiquinol-cytochrome c reductase iron-sulfur subunit [Candidatus Eremiobacteraeota bacterium]